jgi:cardiolipin synthase
MIQFAEGNSIRLLRSGAEFFPALEAAINEAHREIHLETYIFEHDQTGQRIQYALERAAARGVSTHLLIDGFGSKDLAPDVIDDLRQTGVQVLIHRPEISLFKFRRHRLRRLHRKLAVMDGKIGFVGGINIIDDMDTPGQIPPRIDFAVRVEGPLVADIQTAVKRLWALVSRTYIRLRLALWHARTPVPESCGPMRAALVLRDNIRHRHDIEKTYLEAIQRARAEIVLANAYFLPGINFRKALMHAVQRGVRVVLLLQGRVEYRLLHYAVRALYQELLRAGVEIYEYDKSFLHAKVAVIDRQWATVGSSNIDPFSLLLAREANVVVENGAFAQELHQSLDRLIEDHASRLQKEDWERQPFYLRWYHFASFAVVRLLTSMAGYGRDYLY